MSDVISAFSNRKQVGRSIRNKISRPTLASRDLNFPNSKLGGNAQLSYESFSESKAIKSVFHEWARSD